MQPAAFREIQPQTYPAHLADHNYINDSTVGKMPLPDNRLHDSNVDIHTTEKISAQSANLGIITSKKRLNPEKPKRKQVKNACVNCQKACKKCDDGRPCNRCIKLGLIATCRDSDRKERKKGVKRGPYKKRQASNIKSKSEEEQQRKIEEITPNNTAQATTEISSPYENTTTHIGNSNISFHDTSFISNNKANSITVIDPNSNISLASTSNTLASVPTCSTSLSSSSLSSLLPSPLFSNTSLDNPESDETLHYAYGYTTQLPTASVVAGTTNSHHRRNLSSTTSSSTSNMLDHQTISGNITPILDTYPHHYYCYPKDHEMQYNLLQQQQQQQQQLDAYGHRYYQSSYQDFHVTIPSNVFHNDDNIAPFLTGKVNISRNQQQQVFLDLNNVETDFTANMLFFDQSISVAPTASKNMQATTLDEPNNNYLTTAPLLLQQHYDSNLY